jgi:hypothetical protein
VKTAKVAKECRLSWKRENLSGSKEELEDGRRMNEKEFDNQYDHAYNLMNMMVAFQKKIK